MKTTRSLTRRAKPISCVTTTMVIPPRASSTMTSRTSLIISGSSAEVGSSKSIALGCMARDLAMATRCCWPPESWAGIFLACSATPTRRRSSMPSSRALSRGTPSTSTGPMVTLSMIERCAKRLKDWKTMPISARVAASSLPSCGSGLPSMRTSPESMVSSLLMVRQSVDLPEPEGPITTTTSPLPTLRLMSLSTWRLPKCLSTWRSSMTGVPSAASASPVCVCVNVASFG